MRTAILALAFTLAAFAHDVSGKWTFQVETDAGSGTPSFVLKQDGEKLTGTYTGTFGTADVTGSVKGDAITITFTAAAFDNAKVTYTGKIESATKMKGEV